MLIIEGPDLVGKTTLAHACQKILEARRYSHIYVHFTRLPVAFDRYWDYLPFIRRNVVQDRFHMSRQAYGRQFLEQERMNDVELKLLQAKIWEVGGFTVLCLAKTDDFLRKQFEAKNREEMYKLDGIIGVNRKYHDIRDSREFDIDMTLFAEDGWPSERAEEVVNRYLARQEMLNDIYARQARAIRP